MLSALTTATACVDSCHCTPPPLKLVPGSCSSWWHQSINLKWLQNIQITRTKLYKVIAHWYNIARRKQICFSNKTKRQDRKTNNVYLALQMRLRAENVSMRSICYANDLLDIASNTQVLLRLLLLWFGASSPSDSWDGDNDLQWSSVCCQPRFKPYIGWDICLRLCTFSLFLTKGQWVFPIFAYVLIKCQPDHSWDVDLFARKINSVS